MEMGAIILSTQGLAIDFSAIWPFFPGQHASAQRSKPQATARVLLMKCPSGHLKTKWSIRVEPKEMSFGDGVSA
jgi:hypothetical protein